MIDRKIFGSKAVAQMLAFLLALQFAAVPARAQATPASLSIIVVQGEGSNGRVRERATQEPVIRVVDENQQPVVGAAVVFTLPTEGATGVFGNGAKTVTVLTDRNGAAAAQGLRFNQIPGNVQVHVNVSYKGLTARTSILQVSTAPAGYKPPTNGHGHGKIIAILAVLAAGGAAGAVYATQKNGSTTTPTTPSAPVTIGLTPGAGTLAPPN